MGGLCLAMNVQKHPLPGLLRRINRPMRPVRTLPDLPAVGAGAKLPEFSRSENADGIGFGAA